MDTHSDTIRLRLLRLLADNPQLTQRELAQALSVSLGATHYSLRALIDKGLVKAENFRNSQNKRAYAYLLTPKGLTEKLRITRAFLAHKQKECEAIQREIDVLKKELGEDAKTEQNASPKAPMR